MKYLHKYDTDAHFSEDYNGSAYTEPWVSLTQENGEVNYNKDENWISIEYGEGSSGYVNIDDWGNSFDNSPQSKFRVYCENTGEETTYRGVHLYWRDPYYGLYINQMPPCRYFEVQDNGDGGWTIGSGFNPECSE
jgi:hypothetical protein